MSRKWFDNSTPVCFEQEKSRLEQISNEAVKLAISSYNSLDFKGVCDQIKMLGNEANLYLSEYQPSHVL